MLCMHGMNLSSIDLNLLVVLHALLETRSVTAAAKRVSLSQSATSHALGRLRILLGDELLVRAGRSMQTTPRAQRLRPQLASLLEGVQQLLVDDASFDEKTLHRTFTIATVDYGERVFVVPLGQALASIAPQVNLYVIRSLPVVQDLRVGAQDLGIGVLSSTPPEIESEVLVTEKFVCLLRAGHKAAKQRITLKRYAALDHVVVSPGGNSRSRIDTVLASHGLERRVARTVASFEIAPSLVRESDYILTMAEHMARPIADRLGLCVREAPPQFADSVISMAWHRRTSSDPAQQWFREQVRTVAGQLCASTRDTKK